MSEHDIILIGAPVDSGKRRRGCLMGPDAFRVAGLAEALESLGHRVKDLGNLCPDPVDLPEDPHLFGLPETVGWTAALMRAGKEAAAQGFPVFLGGDHALSMGSVAGVAAHAAEAGRPLFLLWLDAHTDFHTPLTTASGNLHGVSVAYLAGREGFEAFPAMPAPLPMRQVCMIGIRSVDPGEREALRETEVHLYDMRHIDEHGIRAPLAEFLTRVEAANGMLHVSLDVDFLDPAIAPAVGTTVPGGATLREAHLVMEMLCDSGLVTSLDLVELNPFLDERGRTAGVMVDLAASLFGRRIFDRPTRSHA
ncbi:arginase [Rubellimicrobium thermophilum DSM 16684]|uniref:Arginase n=1 Tax=Rubellimicrobium thermophilum DSM 16684 TaxID=1123069 RepID=S9QXQ1_9RHOB|nr:arginase [Rubellimicrobium thermophilum]EPX86116.1 arginase [Rubellimicrobium thermophilum DSM 16684]